MSWGSTPHRSIALGSTPTRSRALRGATAGARGGDDDLGRPRCGGRREAAAAKAKRQAGEEDALADGRRPEVLVFVIVTCEKDF